MAAGRWFSRVTANKCADHWGCTCPFIARGNTFNPEAASQPGPQMEGQEQLWKSPMLLRSGNILYKNVLLYQGAGRQLTSGDAHWLHKQGRHDWTASGLGPSSAQRLTVQDDRLPCSASFAPGDDLQRLCKTGRLEEALDVLMRMDQRATASSSNACWSLLQGFMERKALHHVKRLHAHLMKYGLDTISSIGEYVVRALVKCDAVEDALQLFRRIPVRSPSLWTVILSGCAMSKRGWEALRMFQQMQAEGVQPNTYTFVSLLKACASIPNLDAGRYIHAEVLKHGCGSHLFVGNCLVDMYGKCGSIADAQKVFDGLPLRDVVTWTAMLAAYVEQDQAENALQVYLQMQEAGVTPNHRTFVSALQACGILADKEVDSFVDGRNVKSNALARGKMLHAEVHAKGFNSDVFVGSTLITLYHKCGSLADVCNVFQEMSWHDVVAWTSVIIAYAEQGQGDVALGLYVQMLEEGVNPNCRTYVGVLRACSTQSETEADTVLDGHLIKGNSLSVGKALDAVACMKLSTSDVFVGSALISLYAKCGSFMDAQIVFNRLSEWDVVAWTAMLAACAEHGLAEKALQLYEQMWESGVSPDPRSYVSLLKACGMLADKEDAVVVDGQVVKRRSLHKVKVMHERICEEGFHSYIFVGCALVSVYGKCGSIVDAREAFDGLPQRDAVAWTAMLMTYVDHDQAENALQLYGQMQGEAVPPDDLALVSILQVCSRTGDLFSLKQIHHTVASSLTPLLANSLISAYGRCSSMVDAQAVFDALPQPDVVSWTALIAGYARQGDCAASLECYERMQLAGVAPNEVTLLAVLSACSHAGEVEQGVKYFQSIIQIHCIAPGIEHYVTMVDLLGRAGCFESVHDLLSTMQVQPAFPIWLCLLGACQKHGKVELGEWAFRCAVSLQPNHSGPYVLMSNIYADAGLVSQEEEVYKLRHHASAFERPGQTWVYHQQGVRSFVARDRNQMQHEGLYRLLSLLSVDTR